jgi:hypothetical protein
MSTKTCPIESKCCFCWKNPIHIAVALAVLPFVVAGAKLIVGFVNGWFA